MGVVDDDIARFVRRFWAKFTVDDNGCWIWTGAIVANGYGSFGMNNGSQLAHRVAYELLVGPIPDGMEMDHLCRVRRCVNPEHLEPVTKYENYKRGDAPGILVGWNARKTHCKNGHEYVEGSYSVNEKGWRRCLICQRDYQNARRARHRGVSE